MNKKIAIIPARGGSKGVKRKNVRLLNGKPLISYAIETALKSKLLTDIYVTTDDEEIADVASQYNVPVISRPDNLANDKATMMCVVEHALSQISTEFDDDDVFSLLQPTCPFRNVEDIDSSIEQLNSPEFDGVIGVNEALHVHPERFYCLENNYMKPLMPEYNGKNRQELPVFYIRNGIIYTIRINAFLQQKTFTPEKSAPLVVPLKRAINIDEEDDFNYAEYMMAEAKQSA